MRFALVDLQLKNKKANPEHTGEFGPYLFSDGSLGGFISKKMVSLIELPIMSLGFSSAILKNAGYQCKTTQGEVENSDIAVIASSMHCYQEEISYAKTIKKQRPNLKVGFFGPFVGAHTHLFEEVADFTISGELESTILAFCKGKYNFEGKSEFGILEDLGKLPIPDWEDYDWQKFSYFPMLYKRPFFPLIASRGCSFKSDFCPYRVSQTQEFRTRPIENVIEEIKYLHERFGLRSFLFRDTCFTLNKKYSKALATAMTNDNFNFEWGCETRIDSLNEELIDLLFDAGLRGVNLGIETGNNEILESSGAKKPDLEFQEYIIRYMMEKGIRINAFYMLGLIGDTVSTMQDTIMYASKLNTLGAQFCINTPFPRTKLYDDMKDKIITNEFTQFTEYNPEINIETATPDEVKQLHAETYRYYLRPKWIRKHGIKTLGSLVRNGVL